MSDSSYKKPQTISEAYNNPYYQGKIVVESPEGLYSTTKDENAVKKLRQLHKKYSYEKITTTVIPKGIMITMPFEVTRR
ncbi:MAG TPA: hypothetical protein VF209_01155 [Patescibacteria group bacterium]